MADGGRPHHGRVHRSAHRRILSALAAVSACGASGVAGGSLLLIPLACSLFGIGNDVGYAGGGHRLHHRRGSGFVRDGSTRRPTLFTATSEYRQWRKAGKEITFGEDAFSENELA